MPSSDREGEEGRCPSMLPSSSENKWQTKRQGTERKREARGEKIQEGWVLAHPSCCPPWPGPLPKACWSPAACVAERGSQVGCWQGAQRLQGCWWADTSCPSPSPKPSHGTKDSMERVGPRKVGNAVPTHSPEPRVRTEGQTEPHHPGEGPSSPQEIPTVSPTQPHKHVDPAGGPALPPTWAWPCPGPTGGASHPVRLCATPGGPGRSALAPASTGRSPSPPPGAPPLAGGELGQGPGLDSGAPGHPAGRRHKAPWGRNRKSPELGKGIQNLLTPSCLKALRSPHQKN